MEQPKHKHSYKLIAWREFPAARYELLLCEACGATLKRTVPKLTPHEQE